MTFPGGDSGESGENTPGDVGQHGVEPAVDGAEAVQAEFGASGSAPSGHPPYDPSYEPPSQPRPDRSGPYPGYEPVPPRMNSLAIGSLVVSLLGLVPFCGGAASIVGIVLGAIGVKQIRRSGEKGHGVAVAGITISALTLVAGIILTIALEPHWS